MGMLFNRILYAAFDVVPSPKGASTHILSFLEALKRVSAEVTLLTLGSRPGAEETEISGVRHLSVGFDEPHLFRRVELFRSFLEKHLRAECYQAVQFRSIWEGLEIVRLRPEMGYRTVYEVNGLPSVELKYHYPLLASRPALIEKLKRMELLAFRETDRIITPSLLTASLIRSAKVREDRIHHIPNGVDLSLFRPDDDIHASSGLSLLYTGTLAPWQGIGTLIEAMKIISGEARADLIILGSGRKQWSSGYRKLIEKAGLADRITILPAVSHSEVARYIQRADICIAPLSLCDRNTVQGCCPIKILEYMACRKTVVASRIAVVEEILTHGKDSLLFTADDPESLAEAVLKAWRDSSLGSGLAEKAWEKAVSHYSWEKANAELERVYAMLLNPEPLQLY